MNITEEKYQDITDRRKMALKKVQWNLELYFLLKRDGILPVEQRVSISSSSLLKVGESVGIELGKKITIAQEEYEKDRKLLRSYDRYIQILTEPYQSIIINLYIKGYQVSDYIKGKIPHSPEESNIYRLRQKAFLELAFMDDSIHYNKRDEFIYHNESNKKKTKKNNIKTYVKTILDELNLLLMIHDIPYIKLRNYIYHDEELISIVETMTVLEVKEQNLIKSYIEQARTLELSSWDYSILSRGLFSLAYGAAIWDYSEADFIADMKTCKAYSKTYTDRMIRKEKYHD